MIKEKTEFYLERLKKFSLVRGEHERYFVRAFTFEKDVEGDEIQISLRAPFPGEYAEFWGLFSIAVREKFFRALLVRPQYLPRWNLYYVYGHQYGPETDMFDLIEELAGFEKNEKLFYYKKFLPGLREERWIAIIKGTLDENPRAPMRFNIYKEAFPNSTMDDAEIFQIASDTTILEKIMDVPGENLVEGSQDVEREYNEFLRKFTVDSRDWKSIVNFVRERGPDNFVDLSDPFTLEDSELQTWLDTLAPQEGDPDYQLKIFTGVRLINNVIAQNMEDSNCGYLAKKIDVSPSGTRTVVLKNYSPEGLTRLTYSWRFKTIGKKGGEKEKYWFDIWKKHPKRAIITHRRFTPYPIHSPVILCDGSSNMRQVNTFSGYRWNWKQLLEAVMDPLYPSAVEEFEKLLFEGFCSKNKEWFEYLLNWLSFTLQKPDQKTGVLVILKTKQGIGKGFLAKLLEAIWGSYMLFVPGKGVDSDHNSHLADKTLVFLDELNPGSANRQNIDIIKSMITEESTLIHKKYEDQRAGRSVANLIAATNNDVELDIGEDNRRFFILEGKSVETQSEIRAWKPFISNLWISFLKGKEAQENNFLKVRCVFYYLASRHIGNFVPWEKMPVTDYMKKLMDRSIPYVHKWWKFIVERRHLKNSEDQGAPIEYTRWKWFDLYMEFKKNEEFIKLHDQKRKAVTVLQAEFKSYVQGIASLVEEPGSLEFKFNPWTDQIRKWNRNYPYSEIEFRSNENPDPFRTAAAREMRETIIEKEISALSREELEYAVQRLKDEMEEQQVRVTIGKSFLKRKDANENEPLIVISDSNKRRKV